MLLYHIGLLYMPIHILYMYYKYKHKIKTYNDINKYSIVILPCISAN